MANLQKTISPVDGSVYVERELASPAQIEAALARSVEAQRAWRQTPIDERAAICERMVRAMLDQADAIAVEISWQMGRPIRYSPMEITRGFQERARHMVSIAPAALADIPTRAKDGFQRFIRREPLGVVLVLAPWNYPYLTSVNSIVPAVMAGNSVILKHSNQTPLVAERYTEAFRAAGMPEGVVQHLHMTHEDAAQMIGDDRVAFVAFTGSVPGGHAVQEAAARRFIATGMELGGKDPAYVRADADLAYAIENVMDGVMFNSGQSCCGIERVYVHEAVYDAFVEGAVALTNQYVLGSPLDPTTTLGPMVRTSAAELVRRQIRDAAAQGARALIDPAHFPANQEGTPYLAPQILVDVDHRMEVMTEESFGPVVGIMKVRDDAEAVALMNDSHYGLTASIWTQDADAAIHIGDQVETGTWYMNRCDYLDPELAWTGVKDSGRGCTLSVLGYESLTRPKSFHLRTVTG
ncbi:MAG: aldehyde dehydrogenase family protein [Anaerolineae bacterium]|nr:aldehyde dehydrogenase family protein [Anaerolineae bacterium]NUQ02915.1 aldehyde dehydrogenase family protein [Anaerolineae bacterium]